MKRTFAVLLAAIAFGAPGKLLADPPAYFLTNTGCSLTDLTGVTVTACSGFWSGNRLNTGTGGTTDADENAGLAALGITTPVNVLQKLDLADPSTFVNFTPLLYGQTVVAFHWGGGNDVFKNASPTYNGSGGGTAFYLFDAGAGGLDKLYFSTLMSKSNSGATLYLTGLPDDPPGGGQGDVVPEPATMTLLATGLAGMAAASRRRKKA